MRAQIRQEPSQGTSLLQASSYWIALLLLSLAVFVAVLATSYALGSWIFHRDTGSNLAEQAPAPAPRVVLPSSESVVPPSGTTDPLREWRQQQELERRLRQEQLQQEMRQWRMEQQLQSEIERLEDCLENPTFFWCH